MIQLRGKNSNTRSNNQERTQKEKLRGKKKLFSQTFFHL